MDSLSSSITTVHSDIIQTHILTRLDAATLASTASVSSHLRHLCTDEDLWRDICIVTWPSLLNPIAGQVISTFSGGHRSIFSDAFPSLHYFSSHSKHPHRPSPPPSELISAVDIYYQGKSVFSRVQRTETQKNWFLSSPLWLNVVEPNELVPTPVKFVRKDDEWLKHLEENLSLSWVVIDPTRKRAANLSSRRAVSVQRHWLTRELEVLYAVVMAGEQQRSTELVQCVVKVTCCGKVGGELHVKEVNLVMEDMEGRHVTGREGVAILQRAMENGERKKVDGVKAKESFEKFACIMKERRETKHRREKARDVISTLLAFIAFLLFCFLAGL
ncbi:F-box protein At2g27310-like [Gastrolobium bilobum]|uniref:F-box protein At2g27310-like n=1 Tax=Gastrolobium bilobum TaxID=150636 RepID=UPI002AB200AA|nr:F-box protein At2g27310-like [Gastrolobium bilobum]